ncbi:MAG: YciI family protein [Planctomycetota bacterium]
MQYLLMIYTAESVDDSLSAPEMGRLMENYGRFHEELEGAGAFAGGARLRGVSSATSVRRRDGEFTLTDGPFAETKEQLGGYYLVEAASLDEAVQWAKKIPSVDLGTIEVRPVWPMEDDPLETTDGSVRAEA